MRRAILFFILLIELVPTILHSQEIKVKNILTVSDSIVCTSVGDYLFSYFRISEGSFYRIKDKDGLKTNKFLNKKKIKNIQEIWVLYMFNYSSIKGVEGNMWVKLDNNLGLTENIEYDFIPDFLLKNRPSNFINSNTALSIAKDAFRRKSLETLTPELKYNKEFARYTYIITNIISKGVNEAGSEAGETEYCVIDAITKEILRHEFCHYGMIIR